MIITSKSNKTVSFVNSLKNKKARKESGLYIVEGKKMLREAFVAGKKVKTVVLSESAQLDFPFGRTRLRRRAFWRLSRATRNFLPAQARSAFFWTVCRTPAIWVR